MIRIRRNCGTNEVFSVFCRTTIIRMAKGSIPRRKCLEYATGLAMLQIALTFAVIWFYQREAATATTTTSAAGSANTNNGGKVNKEVAVFSSNSDSDSSRLLLSVEYNSIGAKTPDINNNNNNHMLPHPQMVGVLQSTSSPV